MIFKEELKKCIRLTVRRKMERKHLIQDNTMQS